jgi:membrane-associated protein
MEIGQLLEYLRQPQAHLDYLTGAMGPWFYLLLFGIIFAETGLVVTPFLPGDSLLFAVGAVAASATSPLSMPVLLGLLIVAAVLGDAVNYAIGYRLGPKVFKYEQSWFFNKKHLLRAQDFYEKYGSKTIILARFVPIVRTFAPFVAGIGRMRYARFFLYNCVGAVAWVAICLWSGYFFGQHPWVKKNFELVVIAIIVISVLPMVVEFLMAWRQRVVLEKTLRAATLEEGPTEAMAPKVRQDGAA